MLQNKHNWDLTNQLDAKVLKTPARALQQHQFAVCIEWRFLYHGRSLTENINGQRRET